MHKPNIRPIYTDFFSLHPQIIIDAGNVGISRNRSKSGRNFDPYIDKKYPEDSAAPALALSIPHQEESDNLVRKVELRLLSIWRAAPLKSSGAWRSYTVHTEK